MIVKLAVTLNSCIWYFVAGTSLQYQLTRSRHLLNLIMKEVMLLYHLWTGSGSLVFGCMGTYSGIFCHTEGSPTGRGRGRGGRGRGRSRATYGMIS